MEKEILRQLAERIIENLECMSLPKVAHAERESMISEVHGTLISSLLDAGFVQIVKPK